MAAAGQYPPTGQYSGVFQFTPYGSTSASAPPPSELGEGPGGSGDNRGSYSCNASAIAASPTRTNSGISSSSSMLSPRPLPPRPSEVAVPGFDVLYPIVQKLQELVKRAAAESGRFAELAASRSSQSQRHYRINSSEKNIDLGCESSAEKVQQIAKEWKLLLNRYGESDAEHSWSISHQSNPHVKRFNELSEQLSKVLVAMQESTQDLPLAWVPVALVTKEKEREPDVPRYVAPPSTQSCCVIL